MAQHARISTITYEAACKLLHKIILQLTVAIWQLQRKDDVLQIYDKEKGWKFVDKDETINDFLEDKGFEIDSYYDKNDIGFNNFAKKTYERFRELYESDDKTLWNRIRKQIDLVLWNNMSN